MQQNLIFILIVFTAVPYFPLVQSNVWPLKTLQKGFELYKSVEKVAGNSTCFQQIKVVLKDFILFKPWAWKMIDAYSKVDSGLLEGKNFHYGSYDECVNINEIKGNVSIKGKYCLYQMRVGRNKLAKAFLDKFDVLEWLGVVRPSKTIREYIDFSKILMGVCIPHKCSVEIAQKIWDTIEESLDLPINVHFTDLFCNYDEKEIETRPWDIYIFIFFGLNIILIALSTAYDYFVHQKMLKKQGLDVSDSKLHDNYWMTFSIYTNYKRLLLTSSLKNPMWKNHRTLSCLNGIKVLSMLSVLFAHRFLLIALTGLTNGLTYVALTKSLLSMPISIGLFSVDNFLFMSGFLICYIYFSNEENLEKSGGKIKWLYFYLLRFTRLSPALVATILFNMGILKYLTNGPLWPIFMAKVNRCCEATWWITILFLTNKLPFEYQCMEHTWYLGVDSQLYFLSPLILILFKRPKRGIITCLFLITMSFCYTFSICWQNDYSASVFEKNADYYHKIYMTTISRVPAWLIGICFGYSVHKGYTISKKLNNILLGTSLFLISILSFSYQLLSRYEIGKLASALINTFLHPLWIICVGIIIRSCITGNAELINKFLSWKVFTILQRISYSFFLIHFTVLLYLIGDKKTLDYLSIQHLVQYFISDLLFTLITATILYLFYEAPFNNIIRLVYRKELESMIKVNNKIMKNGTDNIKKKN